MKRVELRAQLTDERGRPRPATSIATAGLVVLAVGAVLLAAGGAVLSQSPEEFDLWLVAIGLFVMAGAIVSIGTVQPRLRPDGSRSFSDHASLAEAPALTGTPSPATPPPSRRHLPPARSWATSDTIAGQYAEAARLRTGRGVLRRFAVEDQEPSMGSGYAYSTGGAGPRTGAEGAPLPSRAALEREIERLRARVTELESAFTMRGGPARAAPSSQWPGPSRCVGCQTPLVGGPDDARCPKCGRPLCARCASAVADGPFRGFCPECRSTAAESPSAGAVPAPRATTESAPSAPLEAPVSALAQGPDWSQSRFP